MKEGNDMLKKIMAAALSALTVISLCAVTVSASRDDSGWVFKVTEDVHETEYRSKDNTSCIYINMTSGASLYAAPYGSHTLKSGVQAGSTQFVPNYQPTHIYNYVKENGYAYAALELTRTGGRYEATGVWSPDSGVF